MQTADCWGLWGGGGGGWDGGREGVLNGGGLVSGGGRGAVELSELSGLELMDVRDSV